MAFQQRRSNCTVGAGSEFLMRALLTLMERVGRGDTSDSKFLSVSGEHGLLRWLIALIYTFIVHFVFRILN